MFQWLEDLHKQRGKEAGEQDARSSDNQLFHRSTQHISKAEQPKRQKKRRGNMQGFVAPLLCIPSPTSLPPVIVRSEPAGIAEERSLSDEQLQELVRFLVWLHSRPLVQGSLTQRSWTTDDWDGSDGSLTVSEATSLGCEDDLDLSEVQLKALRRRCQDENWRDSGEPLTPEFGGCPMFAEDFSLSDEQLQQLALYYQWYQEVLSEASSERHSDLCLSTEKLHKLRMTCEHGISSLAPMGRTMDAQTKNCELGLSDAHLQNLVQFHMWHRSCVLSTPSVVEPDNEFGLSCDQVEEIKKYCGWCQSRRISLKVCGPSSGLSKKQLEQHLVRHGKPPATMDVEQSFHFLVPKAVPPSQAKDLPTKAAVVYHFPITDEQLQDLVCLFIWSAAASEGADMEGCDDDLDLTPKQLEQLKSKWGESEEEGEHTLSSGVELASLAEDIGIVKEQLLTLVQYCSWTCSLEGKCFTISVAHLREVRTGCEMQGLTCSWTSNNEGMGNGCNVSDERLQNLMRFYAWRCSTLSCAEFDDEFGLPDKDFDMLIRYLSWCESRAKATCNTSPSKQDMVGACQEIVFSPEAEAVEAGSNGDAEADQEIHTGVALGTQLESLSPTSDLPKQSICVPLFDVGMPGMQPESSVSRVGSAPETTPEPPTPSIGNASKTLEPTDDLSHSEFFSMCREDSDNSTDQLEKMSTKSQSACGYEALECGSAESDVGSKQQFSSACHMASLADSVKNDTPASKLTTKSCVRARASLLSLPSLGLPQLGRNSDFPSAEAVSCSNMEGDHVTSPTHVSEVAHKLQCMFSKPSIGPSRILPVIGEPNYDDDDDDDVSDDTPARKPVYITTRTFPSYARPSQAQTFCGVAAPVETWSWASWQERVAPTSLWASRMLDGLALFSCQEEDGLFLRQSSETLHADH